MDALQRREKSAINRHAAIALDEKRGAGVRFPLLHMLLNPVARSVKSYLLRRGFLDRVAGFIVAVSGSFYVFLTYAKLWELYHGSQTCRSN